MAEIDDLFQAPPGGWPTKVRSVLDRNAGPAFRNASPLVTLPVLFLALLLVAGCGAPRGFTDSIAGVTVSHPVWMPDGWVYYLREVASEGPELWRQPDTQDGGERVLGRQDIKGLCDGAYLLFLFRATNQEVGIATQCAGGTRTQLTAYSPQRTSFRPMASTPFLGGVALAAGKATGYVELPTACGTAIRPIRDGIIEEFANPITVAGRSWKLSGADRRTAGPSRGRVRRHWDRTAACSSWPHPTRSGNSR